VPHLLAGIGYEMFRHRSSEMVMIGVYVKPSWLMDYALMVKVLGIKVGALHHVGSGIA